MAVSPQMLPEIVLTVIVPPTVSISAVHVAAVSASSEAASPPHALAAKTLTIRKSPVRGISDPMKEFGLFDTNRRQNVVLMSQD